MLPLIAAIGFPQIMHFLFSSLIDLYPVPKKALPSFIPAF
jgi:hypothetical protein